MTAQRAPGDAESAASEAAPTDVPHASPRHSPHLTPYDAVVLAGGGARRLGGTDKPGLRVGGRALLDRVLGACSGAGTTVVVAEPRPTARPVVWAREEPAGAGPLAALDAGLRRTGAEQVVVLSADLPFLEERTVGGLLTALRESGADGALLRDADGRDQPLVAAYRSASLKREIAKLAAEHDGLTGLPLRSLTARLELTRVTDAVASFDCDTWDDIAAARARIREHGHVLDEWISAVKDELGIELDVDTGLLLDLARDAAHGVARPAAPLTTFLVGYAAARAAQGGGPEAVADAARKAAALATRWAEEGQSDAGQGAPPAAASSGKPAAAPDGKPTATPSGKPGAAPDATPPQARPDPGQDARDDMRPDAG
ncbi:NTP transferase domain-containing protein [Streptomyces sp. NPDC054871]